MGPAHRLKVAICGGGISGLCLAVALSRYPDIELNIYEAAKEFTEIGAGLSIWNRTVDLFKKLGCFEEFKEFSTTWDVADQAMQFRKSDQIEEGFMYHNWLVKGGMNSFHRAHFLDALVRSLPPGCARFNHRLSSYTESGNEVHLRFENGFTAAADVLFGCDGIKSTVRVQMAQGMFSKPEDGEERRQFALPFWSGRVAYRMILKAETLRKVNPSHHALSDPIMYCGKYKHMVVYPVAGKTLLNIVGYVSYESKEGIPFEDSDLPEPSLDDMKDNYVGWEPEVQQILQCIEGSPGRWPVIQLHPLRSFVRGRVALVGDSAHAATPHHGSGACLAVEDSYVLATLLGDPAVNKSNIATALKIYDRVRRPRTIEVMQGARLSGMNYEFWGVCGDDLQRVAAYHEELTRWISSTDPEDDAREATRLLNLSADVHGAP